MGRNYLDYLDSPEWWTKRKAALKRADYRCERESYLGPRHDGPLDVHHSTYARLGDESADDLVVLCRACHRDERIARNKALKVRERLGQVRLFDRWDDDKAA